jgi:hypothetical protein
MEDWQKHLWKIVATAGQEIEELFREIDKAVAVATVELTEVLESTIEDLQDVFLEADDRDFDDEFPKIDSEEREDIRANLDLNFESYFLEEDMDSDMEFYDIYYLEASAKHQPACVECRHYHGRVYSGNLLVCGMHPEGWQDSQCPDWEK